MSASGTHVIVLPGGGYAQHVAHEAEPVADWLDGLGFRASVFRYPLMVRHPEPLNALRGEIRRLRDGGAERIGLVGFSAGGHLAGLGPAHPVGDHEHRRTRERVVLVVPALPAGVGLPNGFRRAKHRQCSVIARRRTRCRRSGCGPRGAAAADR